MELADVRRTNVEPDCNGSVTDMGIWYGPSSRNNTCHHLLDGRVSGAVDQNRFRSMHATRSHFISSSPLTHSMLGGYDDDNPPAGSEGGRATHSSSKRGSAQESRHGQIKRARWNLQTPPRPLDAAASAELDQPTQHLNPPPVKAIYFIQEYSHEPEETIAEVNAGGTRFSLPRSALRPLMRCECVRLDCSIFFSVPLPVSLPRPPQRQHGERDAKPATDRRCLPRREPHDLRTTRAPTRPAAAHVSACMYSVHSDDLTSIQPLPNTRAVRTATTPARAPSSVRTAPAPARRPWPGECTSTRWPGT